MCFHSAGPFVLCVIDQTGIADALADIVQGQVVGEHSLTCAASRTSDDLQPATSSTCRASTRSTTLQLLGPLKDSAVLTVSDCEQFAMLGGVANLFVDDHKMRFAINLESAHRCEADAERQSCSASPRSSMSLRRIQPVRRWFVGLSLAHKLTVLSTVTSAVSMTMLCAILGWHDASTLRAHVVDDTEVLVSMIGANSTAALTFGDTAAGDDTLRALGGHQQVLMAAILLPNGDVLSDTIAVLERATTPLQFDRAAVHSGRHVARLPRYDAGDRDAGHSARAT